MAPLVAVILLVEFATFKTTFNMPWDRFYESVEDKTILSIESCWMKAFQERFQRLKCRMHRIHWRRLSSLLQLAAITVVYGSIRSCCLFRFLIWGNPGEISGGWTHFPDQVRHIGSLESNLKSHAGHEITEVKIQFVREVWWCIELSTY